jgi:hypothetical protein
VVTRWTPWPDVVVPDVLPAKEPRENRSWVRHRQLAFFDAIVRGSPTIHAALRDSRVWPKAFVEWLNEPEFWSLATSKLNDVTLRTLLFYAKRVSLRSVCDPGHEEEE